MATTQKGRPRTLLRRYATASDCSPRWRSLGRPGYAYFSDAKLGKALKAYEQAVSAFKEAIQLKPNHVKAWIGLGKYALMDKGEGSAMCTGS